MEVEAISQHWESETQEVIERVVRAEAERDAARHEASMAKLDVEEARSTRAHVESKLARVQDALAAFEEARKKGESTLSGAQRTLAASEGARRKAEDEAGYLTPGARG